jgi:hypothetical protein
VLIQGQSLAGTVAVVLAAMVRLVQVVEQGEGLEVQRLEQTQQGLSVVVQRPQFQEE